MSATIDMSDLHRVSLSDICAFFQVRKPTQEAYQNELKIESVERSFILSAR